MPWSTKDMWVAGWLDKETGILYFDSNRLFPEDQRDLAIAFAKANGQHIAYVLSTGEFIDITASSASASRRAGQHTQLL